MTKKQSDLIKNMKDTEVLVHLYLTQAIILVLAGAMGYFLFEDLNAFQQIWDWDLKEILLYGGGSAIIVITIDYILMKCVPKEMYDDGGINEKVFQQRSVLSIIIISLVVAFAEELFFRGIIQTHFGYIIASLIFAILHIRYLYKWLLFTIVVGISFFIGWIYMITGNLWVTIFAHFLIDLVFALLIRIQYLRNVSITR